jgi:transcriptional regulator with XRE-family HTH domain
MDLGLRQADVAAATGTHLLSVTNWELGHSEPELRFMPAVLRFLGYDPRPAPATISDRLISFREGKGWSRNRLARELRVDPSTLARWEVGKRKPSGEHLERMTTLLSTLRKS